MELGQKRYAQKINIFEYLIIAGIDIEGTFLYKFNDSAELNKKHYSVFFCCERVVCVS